MELTGRFALTAIPANANQHCFPPLPRRNAPDPQFLAPGGKAAEGVWAQPRNIPPQPYPLPMLPIVYGMSLWHAKLAGRLFCDNIPALSR